MSLNPYRNEPIDRRNQAHNPENRQLVRSDVARTPGELSPRHPSNDTEF